MKENQTIESRTADVILQKAIEVKVGEKTYKVPRPTLATLILVSEHISRLPDADGIEGKSKIIASLMYGKHADKIADVLAIMIVGGKAIMQTKRNPLLFWRKSPLKRIKKEVLCNMTPREITKAVTDILVDMQLNDFFDITTFLTEVNVTRKTKVEKPTQSGRQ